MKAKTYVLGPYLSATLPQSAAVTYSPMIAPTAKELVWVPFNPRALVIEGPLFNPNQMVTQS